MTEPLHLLPWLAPGLFALGAACAALRPRRAWPILARTTAGALILTLAADLAMSWSAHGAAGMAPAAAVASLVAFLGWVIGEYSGRYLAGEPGQSRFVVAFLITLASIDAVVASTNLAALIAAWALSSAGLHHLLTFYRDRPSALIVAHKKFLASRLAEICLIAAACLLYMRFGTLDLDSLARLAGGGPALPAAATAAAALIAVAVVLKSAQLPLHGWLIQVMEAPTPVSALLHAGVVNLGGYVLIRLAPLISAAPAAQIILVAAGSVSAVVAGLVTMTRVTIKVRLAWSTCSQMGFMLMECGLGLYDLALLHLIAHALYKAHAFLTAGEAVKDSLVRAMLRASGREARAWLAPLAALPMGIAIAAGSAVLWHTALGAPTPPWVATVLLGFGLATLLGSAAGGLPGRLRALGAAVAGAQLYLGWHWIAGAATAMTPAPVSPLLAGWVLLAFLVLYAAQWGAWLHPGGAWANRLHAWVYAGFYLDERFTRLTFRVWPARIAPRAPGQESAGARIEAGSTA